MSKVKCVVVTDEGPRLIGSDGKRYNTKKGDEVEVSPSQAEAWNHQLKPVAVAAAEKKVAEEVEKAKAKAAPPAPPAPAAASTGKK